MIMQFFLNIVGAFTTWLLSLMSPYVMEDFAGFYASYISFLPKINSILPIYDALSLVSLGFTLELSILILRIVYWIIKQTRLLAR